MSFDLKKFLISQETIDDVNSEEFTEQDNDELHEAFDEVESARKDIDTATSDSARLEAVREQLELQEEVADKISEQNDGKLPESSAAILETSRRVATAAIGVDPDSKEGEEYVSTESIVARMEGRYLGLEADEEKNEGFISKVKETIKKIWEWIKEKVSAFIKWIDKITNIVPKKFKRLYDAIKNMSEEDFKAKLASFNDETSPIIENGKVDDLSVKIKEVESFLKANWIPLTNKFKKSFDLVKDTKESRADLHKRIVEDFAKLNKDFTIKVNGYVYHCEDNNRPFAISVKGTYNGKIKDISRASLLDALNQGISTRSKLADLSKTGKIYAEDTEKRFGGIKSEPKMVLFMKEELVKLSRDIVNSYTTLTAMLVRHQNSLIKLANRFLSKDKKEDTVAASQSQAEGAQ